MKKDIKKRQERSNYQNETSFIYGEQTWGRVYQEIDKEFGINTASTQIKEACEKLNIASLENMTVLDIGTGRQALEFQKMGAKKVYHVDISRSHIENTKQYCAKHNIENIESKQLDLTKDKLPENTFDLVYAAGIYQHLMPPQKGLVNFAQSLKVGGRLYMGFYRSGDWRWFVVSLIRLGIVKSDFVSVKQKLMVSASLYDPNHFQIARVLDDFFVPAQSYFHPRDILDDIEQCGLEKVYLSDDMRDYCHESEEYHSVGG
jgi:SAM-dependent methyltransferase